MSSEVLTLVSQKGGELGLSNQFYLLARVDGKVLSFGFRSRKSRDETLGVLNSRGIRTRVHPNQARELAQE